MALALHVSAEGRDSETLTLDQPRIVIGRGGHADVRLPSRRVSEQHAVLRVEGSDVSVTDDTSTNGTRVNGVVIPRGRRKVLRDGDELGLGDFTVRVQFVSALADPPERTASLARKLLRDALRSLGGEAAPPYLELRSGKTAGLRWDLPKDGTHLVLGRGERCDVLLDDRDCSREHAEAMRDGEGVLLRDLGSKNGIVMGGRSLTERRLRSGDEFMLGRSTLRLVDPTEELLRGFDGGDDEPAPAPPPRPSAPPRTSTPPPAAEPDAVTRTTPAMEPAVVPAAAVAAVAAAPPERALARSRGDGDYLVLALSVLILVVSVAALVVVLKS